MLVLSRHQNERILIGDDIEIVVVDIRGDKVRLGITAPPSVDLIRAELLEEGRQWVPHATMTGSTPKTSNVPGHRDAG